MNCAYPGEFRGSIALDLLDFGEVKMYARMLREKALNALDIIRCYGKEFLVQQVLGLKPEFQAHYRAITNGLYTGCLRQEEFDAAESHYQKRKGQERMEARLEELERLIEAQGLEGKAKAELPEGVKRPQGISWEERKIPSLDPKLLETVRDFYKKYEHPLFPNLGFRKMIR